MADATTHGYPYPEEADAITDYPAIAQELADLLEARLPRIVRGIITGSGGISDGDGFTVVRNSAGNYTITLTTDFDATPVITLGKRTSDSPGNASWIGYYSATAHHFTVETLNQAGSPADPASFSFEAVEA